MWFGSVRDPAGLVSLTANLDRLEKSLLANPKILIAEDEMLTSDHLSRVLSRLGYEVAGVAASGEAALEQIAQANPDLLLADIGLDGPMDGVEVAARARDEYHIPTVFLTAYSDPETLKRAKVTEPYGYLVKPFVEEELHATIEVALLQNNLRGQRAEEAKLAAHSEVAARLIQVQEQERSEIARDLHDDVGQLLAVVENDFANLWRKIPLEIQTRHKLDFDQVMRRAHEVSDTVRGLSHRLHPSILEDLGIVVALRELAEEFEDQYGMPARFSARGISDGISNRLSLPLYRITQEALRNIGKHAGPAQVNIALVGTKDHVELSIRDTGKGFDWQRGAVHRSGLGFISMAERAEAAGGKLKIESRLGEGTRIHVTLPLNTSP